MGRVQARGDSFHFIAFHVKRMAGCVKCDETTTPPPTAARRPTATDDHPMLGPVFSMELLRAARRGRAHGLRWLYAGWLVLQFLYLFGNYANPPHRYSQP